MTSRNSNWLTCRPSTTRQTVSGVARSSPIGPHRNAQNAVATMTETGVDGNGLYGWQTRRGNLAYGGGPHEWLADTGMAVPAGVADALWPATRALFDRSLRPMPGVADFIAR